MRPLLLLAFAGAILTTTPALAEPAAHSSNPEMTRLYDADQADREGSVTAIDWSKVGPRDAQRRAATRRLLETNALHTGVDFEHAAFIFQHGAGPDDLLVAHALAMIAIAKGNKGALWIATASLDRYLQDIGQPQIFGTQYGIPNAEKPEVSQEPYNRTLVSDALRHQLGVPSQAKQAGRLEDLRREQAKHLKQ